MDDRPLKRATIASLFTWFLVGCVMIPNGWHYSEKELHEIPNELQQEVDESKRLYVNCLRTRAFEIKNKSAHKEDEVSKFIKEAQITCIKEREKFENGYVKRWSFPSGSPNDIESAKKKLPYEIEWIENQISRALAEK